MSFDIAKPYSVNLRPCGTHYRVPHTLNEKLEPLQSMSNIRVICALCWLINASWFAEPSQAQLHLPQGGVNLSSYRYWSTAYPFRDVAKMGNAWISTDGNVWDDQRSISLTSEGFPASLLSDQQARSLVFTHNDGIYPTGTYELQWRGQGVVELDGNVTLNSTEMNSASYTVETPNNLGLLLYIRETDPADPVRDIRLTLPESANWQTDLNPNYLQDLQAYSVLRHIDWNATNNSTIAQWGDRTTLQSAHWGSSRGVPYEMQIQLSNELQQDLWVSIPHRADDEYVANLANLINTQLDPELRVWVEYSNEVWNGIFTQHQYARDVLQPRFGTDSPTEAYGRRSAELFEIFENEVSNPDRMLRVIAGQAANAWQLEQAIKGATWADQVQADVAAIAPYVTLSQQQMELLHKEFREGRASIDRVFRDLFDRIEVLAENWIANQQVAHAAGLPLVAYEAGQHLDAVDNFQRNDADFVEFLHELNRDPRMGDLYLAMADKWEAIGGETLVFYNDVAAWSRYGSWGLKESYLDDDSVKYAAVQRLLNRVPGDTDLDGEVDFTDFLQLSANSGNPGVWSNGDFDHDDVVTFSDFLLLSANFQRGLNDVQPVPESTSPSATALLCLSVCYRHRRGRRRSKS